MKKGSRKLRRNRKKATDKLESQDSKGASENQKKAGQKMKEMGKKMEAGMQAGQMEIAGRRCRNVATNIRQSSGIFL